MIVLIQCLDINIHGRVVKCRLLLSCKICDNISFFFCSFILIYFFFIFLCVFFIICILS